MKKVERVSLVESVGTQLREEITAGRWSVGERIPSETELVGQLGVSRASVREAVRGLVHAGLLATRQGDGTYVTARDATDVAIRRRLGVAEHSDVVEVRRGLDIVAAGLAASRRTSADVRALDRALMARAAAGEAGDEAAFVTNDVEFHLCVARASHNPVLIELYTSFARALAESVRDDKCLQVFSSGEDSWHEALAAAIEAGDSTTAAAASLSLLESST
ncbi:DNA-binding FadR family transcriptional regulator [Kribbella aluminosa]|uniref:DNA-binding FadR family transcriptional regulator n=1 Tax=Kribbella aluminosa TaxID=416017 RepID=A0ABS4UKL2_9ACTN|nr:FadR/GntR family transcriptional regulator [Kribbella aluminosa]MBP2352074.1 DNA-binding FadR family transcriptional regulator [Kribbella aluminosa]